MIQLLGIVLVLCLAAGGILMMLGYWLVGLAFASGAVVVSAAQFISKNTLRSPQSVSAASERLEALLDGDTSAITTVSRLYEYLTDLDSRNPSGRLPAGESDRIRNIALYAALSLNARNALTAAEDPAPFVFADTVNDVAQSFAFAPNESRAVVVNHVGTTMRVAVSGARQFTMSILFVVCDFILKHATEDTVVIDARWNDDSLLELSVSGSTESDPSDQFFALVTQAIRGKGVALQREDEGRVWKITLPITLPSIARRLAHSNGTLGHPVILAGNPKPGTPEWTEMGLVGDWIERWGLDLRLVQTVAEAITMSMHDSQRDAEPPIVVLFEPGLKETGRDLVKIAVDHEVVGKAVFILIKPRDGHGQWKKPYLKVGFREVVEAPVDRSLLYHALMSDRGDIENVASYSKFKIERSRQKNLAILVATYDGWSQASIQQTLELLGHTVSIVSTGQEALVELERETFDVALFAQNMPMMDGLEAARTLHFTKPLSRIMPIILLVGESSEEPSDDIAEADIDAILTLPIEPATLVSVVQDVVKGREAKDSKGKRVGDQADVIDVTLLRQLSNTSLDASFVDTLVDSFLSDAARLLDRLEASRERDDWEEYQKVAIALKGSASSIGAKGIADLCRDIAEWDTSEETAAQSARMRDQLASMYEASRAYMQRFKSDDSA